MYFAQCSFILLNRSSGQSVEANSFQFGCCQLNQKSDKSWVNCSRISDSVIHKLLTVSEINICCFIFGFGLEVSNEGIHALKNKNALSNI